MTCSGNATVFLFKVLLSFIAFIEKCITEGMETKSTGHQHFTVLCRYTMTLHQRRSLVDEHNGSDYCN